MADENENGTENQDPGTEGGERTGDQGDGLGDAGRAALQKERAARKEAEKARRALEAEIAAIREQAQQSSDEAAKKAEADRIRQEATEAATARANERILAAEVRAAAAGKLSDPADALRFLDMKDFEVAEDGSVDAGEISGAISDLIKSKPYLAATAQGFQGSGDNGSRGGKPGGPPQITSREALRKMSSAEIVKARKEGRLEKLLRGE